MREEVLDFLWLLHAVCGALVVCVCRRQVYDHLHARWLQVSGWMKALLNRSAAPSDPLEDIVEEMMRELRLFLGSKFMVGFGCIAIVFGHFHMLTFRLKGPARPLGAEAALRLHLTLVVSGAMLPAKEWVIYLWSLLLPAFGVLRALSAQHYVELISSGLLPYTIATATSLALLDRRHAVISQLFLLLMRLAVGLFLLEESASDCINELGYSVDRELKIEFMVIGVNIGIVCCVEMSVRAFLRRSLTGQAALGEIKSIWSLADAVCDCVVRLDREFNILGPSPKLASMLQNQRQSMQGANLTHYMEDADRARFEKFIAASASKRSMIEDEDCDTIAQALHVTLRDAVGLAIHVEVFHVLLRGLDGSISHIVGLREHHNGCSSPGVGSGNLQCQRPTDTSTTPGPVTPPGQDSGSEDVVMPLPSETRRRTHLASVSLKFKLSGEDMNLVHMQAAFCKEGAEGEAMKRSCPKLEALLAESTARNQSFSEWITSGLTWTSDQSWQPDLEDASLRMRLPFFGQVSARMARKVGRLGGDGGPHAICIDFDEPTVTATPKEKEVDRPRGHSRSPSASAGRARGSAEEDGGGATEAKAQVSL
eukprot:TRINITY_DN18248_c0_g1_i3.p1 TRINITY_DN18248_c0_g1~~TRINITY_DN18248_c0_g1_i3.p1  ORF type:complete len:616 (+),score=75.44 TRINITY_DN18248_c0_g1_i3:66-1850(+)